MEVTFSSAKQLKGIAEALHDLVSEINVYATGAGLSIQTMDTCHVCLVSVNLAFDDVDIFGAYSLCEEITLGVNVSNLLRALKCAGNDDTARMTCSSTDALRISFESPDSPRVAEFDLKLMLIESDRFTIPPTEDAVRFKMSGALFARAIKDLAGLGDTVLIRIDRDEESAQQIMTLVCEGDIGRASIAFKTPVDLANNKRSRNKPTRFSLKHMVSIAKASSLAEDVVLELVDDMPLSAEFFLSAASSIKFHLAPKVTDEEDETGVTGANDVVPETQEMQDDD